MILALIVLALITPAASAQDGNIVIKKRANPYRRKALLDYKFIYLQEKSSVQPSRQANLSSLNSSLRKIRKSQPLAKPARANTKNTANQASKQDQWSEFAVEEELSVQAVLK